VGQPQYARLAPRAAPYPVRRRNALATVSVIVVLALMVAGACAILFT
jgi:hypothetical protein